MSEPYEKFLQSVILPKFKYLKKGPLNIICIFICAIFVASEYIQIFIRVHFMIFAHHCQQQPHHHPQPL